MNDRRLARVLHNDVPTLFEAPIADQDVSGVVLLGVPYEGVLVGDRHTLYPPGSRPPETFYARHGADAAPDAIRRTSVIYSLEHDGGVAAELDFARLSDELHLVDAGNHSLESCEQLACSVAEAGGVTVALGGDHLVPLPLIRGLQKGHQQRLAVVVFDSHLDLHAAPPLWAGSQWRTLIDAGHLRPSDLTIIGARGVRHSLSEIDYARQHGVNVVPLRALDDRGIDAVCAELAGRLQAVEAVYVSLDIDVVDPSFCPAQKYPDAAGLAPREILRVMRAAIAAATFAGFDLCCLSPRYDEGQRGALLAARFALEAVYACRGAVD